MNSIFDDASYRDVLSRINKIEETTTPLWGKMTSAQMFAHNVVPLEIVLEKRLPIGKPNFLMKLLFKKMMYNNRPFNKNLPTPGPFQIESEKNFYSEKQKLTQLIDEVFVKPANTEWPIHPTFGKFSRDQTGKILYKHLDHHLRQFGV